jgi:hypothetical protein
MRKQPFILSADVPPRDAVRARVIARASRTTVSEIIREALAEWLARRT